MTPNNICKFLLLLFIFSFSLRLEANDYSNNAYAGSLIGLTEKGIAKDSLAEKWNQKNHHLSALRRNIITQFSATKLSAAHQNTNTVFYPFGGPDAIYPHLFFPYLKTLILVGTEEVGTLPNLSENPQQYSILKTIMGTLFDHTFYHTNKMTADQTASPANASLTKILASLALLNASIDRITLLKWSSNGSFEIETPPANARILRIEYTLNGISRNVFYFQQNLGDTAYKGLSSLKSKESLNFVNFVKMHNGYTSFYKAASFLSHYDSFNFINQLNLEHSNYIVQTDTGIPYKKIKESKNWNIYLFGKYKWPKAPFEGSFRQNDLMEDMAYSNQELPFAYCYNFAIDGSHIIYAERR